MTGESQHRPSPPRGPLPGAEWLGWSGMYNGVAHAVVALVPVALLATWVLVRCRQKSGTTSARVWRLSSAEVGIVYLTLPALWVTMVPGARAGQVPARVCLVPLQDLATMSTFQIVGNLLLLAPLGLLVPIRFAALASFPRVLAVAAIGSTLIETGQYVLPLDRVASIDDVLLNTAGAGLAALVSRPWWLQRPTTLSGGIPPFRGQASPSGSIVGDHRRSARVMRGGRALRRL